MKNLFYFILIFICSLNSEGQITYVEYNTRPIVVDTLQKRTSKWSAVTSAKSKLKFELIFDTNKSIFFLQDNGNDSSDMNYKIAAIMSGGSKKHFKDISLKTKRYETELAGQFFNVEDNFEKYNWEVTQETKMITGFLCYKATAKYTKIDKGKNTSNQLTAVAWFTPKIPSSFGPNGIDGLPGLVLEGSLDGIDYLYASKIILDYDDKSKMIDKSPKGIKMTEDEFQDYNAKMYNEIKRY